jgi:hypothetical protein
MMLRQTWSLTLQNSIKNTLKPGVAHSDPEPQKPIKGADMADGSMSISVDDTDTITVPVEEGGGGDKDPPVETKTDEDEPAPKLAERASTELKVVTVVSTSETASTSEPSDKFDLNSLRLSQNFAETAGVKKLLTTVPVRKPNPQDFIRVHPGVDYRADLAMIELKDEHEEYIVSGHDLIGELTGEIKPKTLFTTISRQGVVFLWPVQLPVEGKQDEWVRSRREAAEIGIKRWVRVKANMSLGAYEMTVAESAMAEPIWPEVTFQELIKIAFRDRLITTIDHPVIKRLRGL